MSTSRPDLRALASKLTRETDDFRRIAVAARRVAATSDVMPPASPTAAGSEAVARSGT
ncbi:hypothetical protein [Streptomyces sp.]|uniref:hypothetical protein n=1 Tax=Streptomyces sp. TaxID=1931 RepID=UPI002F41CE44